MSLPATEDFAGAAANLAGSWTQSQTAAGTIGKDGAGQGRCNTGGDCIVYWNADAFSNDQYAQVKVYNVGGGVTSSAAVRCSGIDTTRNGYVFQAVDGLWKCINNVFSAVASDPTTWVNGDLMKLSVSGSTLKMYKNGVQVGSDATDSSLASGAAGVHMYGASANRVDDWEGGDVGGGGGGAAQLAFRRLALMEIGREGVVFSPVRR